MPDADYERVCSILVPPKLPSLRGQPQAFYYQYECRGCGWNGMYPPLMPAHDWSNDA